MKKWIQVVLKESKDGTASLSTNYTNIEQVSDGLGIIGIRLEGCDLYLKEPTGRLCDVEIPNHNIAYMVTAEVPDDSVA